MKEKDIKLVASLAFLLLDGFKATNKRNAQEAMDFVYNMKNISLSLNT